MRRLPAIIGAALLLPVGVAVRGLFIRPALPRLLAREPREHAARSQPRPAAPPGGPGAGGAGSGRSAAEDEGELASRLLARRPGRG